MTRSAASSILPIERIVQHIFLIRGQRVMLSPHLAELYGVEPKVLVQAVKRNHNRFPDDFMFQLTRQEFDNLKPQFVTSSWGGMHRATPYAFMEQENEFDSLRSQIVISNRGGTRYSPSCAPSPGAPRTAMLQSAAGTTPRYL